MTRDPAVSWRFNPYEIAFVGYRASGKTTLAEAMAGRFQAQGHSVGYLKPAVPGAGPALDLLEPDVLQVEGHKDLPLPRIALVDAAGALFRDPALRAHPPLAFLHAGVVPAQAPDLPRFHRDDLDRVEAFIRTQFEARRVPLRGLVLANVNTPERYQEVVRDLRR
ncbi:MAG: hypothetical protein P4L36_15225 [Holophaga sp.]|nr:hypothetical protein [Holophaga sp.]